MIDKKIVQSEQRLKKEQAPDKELNELADVLPEAIKLSHEQRNEEMSSAMRPLFKHSLQQVIRADPQQFADLFYPVVAPSIRLSVANATRSLFESLNQTAESATTIKGLKWRFEALREGVPYAEIALRNAISYRVEQIFLIRAKDGILIEHLISGDVRGLDSDAVSAMLSAIQSFVHDSFSVKDGDGLTDLKVGNLTVWLVHGSAAILATVIRGEAPHELRDQLQSVLEQIHADYSQELTEYTGSGEIEGVQDCLKPYLQIKLKRVKKRRFSISTLLIFLLLLGSLGYQLYRSFDKTHIRNETSIILAESEGIIPSDVFWLDNKLVITGMMDPLSSLPWSRLEELGLDKDTVVEKMRMIRSLEPTVVGARLKHEFRFLEKLKVFVTQKHGADVVELSGELDYSGYRDVLSRMSTMLHGDLRLDTAKLIILPDTIKYFVMTRIGLPDGVDIEDSEFGITLTGMPDVQWFYRLVKLFEGQSGISTIHAPQLEQRIQSQLESAKLSAGELGDSEKLKQAIDQLAVLINQLEFIRQARLSSLQLSLLPRELDKETVSGILEQLAEARVDTEIITVDWPRSMGSAAKTERSLVQEIDVTVTH